MRDADDLASVHSHPEVTRFVSRLDSRQASERVLADERQWAERGYGLLAVLARDTGRFLGRVGLKYWPQFDETEVGWVVRRDAWGHGYATEAGRACVDWGFSQFDLRYLTAMIRPDNARSISVAERLGMAPLRSDALHGIPVVVHAIDRETWRGNVTTRAAPAS
jgi:RimJ/RimL family protein N-acetyltransferase